MKIISGRNRMLCAPWVLKTLSILSLRHSWTLQNFTYVFLQGIQPLVNICLGFSEHCFIQLVPNSDFRSGFCKINTLLYITNMTK